MEHVERTHIKDRTTPSNMTGPVDRTSALIRVRVCVSKKRGSQWTAGYLALLQRGLGVSVGPCYRLRLRKSGYAPEKQRPSP